MLGKAAVLVAALMVLGWIVGGMLRNRKR